MLKRRRITLHAPDGMRFTFDPGALCLDLVVTGGKDWRSVFETLHTPGDLDAWLRQLLGGAGTAPATPADLEATTELREAFFYSADARADGRPLPQGSVDLINQTAATPPITERIDEAGHRTYVTPITPSQVLSELARDAVALFGGPPGRIRRCEGTNCALLFADTSRPGKRRWCSMERCGNRAKIRTFRNQQHTDKEQA
jgi:predicted RNA-binding Zn ribbon-like protein